MDYEGLRQFASSPPGVYVVGIGLAAGGALVGYAAGALRASGRRVRIIEAESSARVAEAKAREAEYAHQTILSNNSLEEQKLQQGNAAANHERAIQLAGIKRTQDLEDRTYEEQRKETERGIAEQEREKDRAHSLQLAEKLTGLPEAIQPYMTAVAEAICQNTEAQQEYLKRREEFRVEMYDKAVEHLENDDELMTQVFDENVSDIFDDDSRAKLEQIVDARFPTGRMPVVQLPQLPEPLKRIVDLLR